MKPLQTLRGVRVLSLALNLPGPAALMRLQQMGAHCTKLEAKTGADPMALYSQAAYAHMHQGTRRLQANLKTPEGQAALHKALSRTQVLIASFRPAALEKLGLGWKKLQQLHPHLSMVAIVGAPGERANEAGHDLTYMAENDLIEGLNLPSSLYADMGGSLMTTEAVLQLVALQQQRQLAGKPPKGQRLEVALSEAAAYLALPRTWGLAAASSWVGGGHAGYQVYACKNGRVALAALEPHFASTLLKLLGLGGVAASDAEVINHTMVQPETRRHLVDFFASKTRGQLEKLAAKHDLPLHTLP
jgi:crotonobetainyl-CoA:carnitine CoA-transferase CaiB-like acyl-CoA transferase